jgi:hypothetical protein
MSPEEELVEQFRHELPLRVGDELKALLSSCSGKDDAFYVLLVNENTLAIDQAMSQFQSNPIVNRPSSEIPRLKTFVRFSCHLTRSRISSLFFQSGGRSLKHHCRPPECSRQRSTALRLSNTL